MLANLWIVILLFYSTSSFTQSKFSPVFLTDGGPKHLKPWNNAQKLVFTHWLFSKR